MRFIVYSTFNRAPTPEILALYPQESARGAELDAAGVREAFYVAADNSGAWQVLRAATRDQLDAVLASFPLHPYLAHTVTQLAEPAR